MPEVLLIFLEAEGAANWLRLKDGAVIGRGVWSDAGSAPQGVADGLRIMAAVPTEAVILHWVELSSALSPPQAIVGARLAGASLTTQPMSQLHVAVGQDVTSEGRRLACFVDLSQMEAWIARLKEGGLEADIIIPDALLLPVRPGTLVRFDRNGVALVRGEDQVFAIEADVVEMITQGHSVDLISIDSFEAALGSACNRPALNLLQGPYSKRRRWKVDRRWVRRMALMLTAVLILTFAIELTKTIRYSIALDALEAERAQIIGRALELRSPPADPDAVMSEQLRQLGASGRDYDNLLAALFGVLQATPNVELTDLGFTEDGTLRATIAGDSGQGVLWVPNRLQERGLVTNVGPLHQESGRATVRLAVRSQ